MVDGTALLKVFDNLQNFHVGVGEVPIIWVDRWKPELDPEPLSVVPAHAGQGGHLVRGVLGLTDNQIGDPIDQRLLFGHTPTLPHRYRSCPHPGLLVLAQPGSAGERTSKQTADLGISAARGVSRQGGGGARESRSFRYLP